MEVKEVTVNVGVTKEVQKFEFLRLDYSLRVQLENEEDRNWSESIDRIRNALMHKINTDLPPIKEWFRNE